jgi:methionyl aminopeptidase
MKMVNKLGRNDMCWCGSNRKYKVCHAIFDDKIAAAKRQGNIVPSHNIIKTPDQIQGLRESSKINVAVLDYVGENIKAGMSTEEIDKMVYEKTTQMGGIPAPLNFEGYPKSVCVSLNNVVCHGIPSDHILIEEGDIVNVDVSTIYKGYFSDSSRMYCIGEVSNDKKKLVQVAKECVYLGLEQVKPWGYLGDVAQAINDHANANGYSIVRDIGGHGIGLEFHEEPWVSYIIPKNTGMLMAPGMVFTIEPMVNMGRSDIYVDKEDEWTVYTEDDMPSAQWEIMVLVTESGYEVLAD